MKLISIVRKVALIVVITLFCAHMAAVRAATPEIIVTEIPPLGQFGSTAGKVIWDELTSENANQYAIIAMLHAIDGGWQGYFVKPDYDHYLNAIDAGGNFSMAIATAGVDNVANEIFFYFVKRSEFSGITGESLNHPNTMTGRYLALATIYRDVFEQPPLPPAPNIRPGFVPANTGIQLSCREGGVIFYTLDGTNPLTSPTAFTYTDDVFTVPEDGVLLIKAVAKVSDTYSRLSSLLWMPKEPLPATIPFFGLNVSLALNGESFGFPLNEADTRKRMVPVPKLTKWVRTFGTKNNGLEYINKIAKESGLRTMVGLYITNDAAANSVQIEGLRSILQNDPAPPDLIAVGNETMYQGVSPATLASCIDEVREMVLEEGLTIPIGSVDINLTWNQSVLERLDFFGVNLYPSTWDNTPENQMLDILKQSYAQTLASYPSKFIMLTETGTPYAGGAYFFTGGSQTASIEKAVNYLTGFLDWTRTDEVPTFYFEAYDEPAKAGDAQIEQYFGIMDGNRQIHQFYCDCLPCETINTETLTHEAAPPVTIFPNPNNGRFSVAFPEEGNYRIRITDISGMLIKAETAAGLHTQIDIGGYPKGIYLLTTENEKQKVIVKVVKNE